MNDACKNALILLVLQKLGKPLGLAYQRYGIWYDEQFDGIGNIWFRCAICDTKIASCFDTTNNIAAIPYEEMRIEASKHGIEHLREKNLLVFL